MKNGKTILIVLVAFTLGYIVRMLVVPNDEAVLLSYKPIPKGDAQTLVTNYTGPGNYYMVSNELFDIMTQLSKSGQAGDGYAIYFGATGSGKEYSNIAIAAQYKGPEITSEYFATTALSGDRGSICPKNCDLPGGLSTKESEPQLEPLPIDTVIPDNEEPNR